MTTNNYVWEKDISLNDLVLKQKEEIQRLKGALQTHEILLQSNTKEIERLNNIINDLLDRQNKALRYIGNHLSLDNRYKHGNGDEELILVRKILNKHIQKLKGSGSNE